MINGTVARVLGVVVCCGLGACGETAQPTAATGNPPIPAAPIPPPIPAKPPAKEPGTWYRAQLAFTGIGDLPFFLHLPPKGESGRGYVLNGEETTDFKVEWRDTEVTITGPWNYTSKIEAELRPSTGKLEGTWTRDTPLWGAVVRDFSATPIAAPDPRTRFPGGDAGKPPSAAWTWQFQFAEHKEGKGVFQQDADGVVRGYVKPGQLGDIRYLAGNIHGDKLAVSQFNGNSANLVLAQVSPDGMSMSGVMSLQNVWNEKFTAKKVEDFQFVNKVRLKAGKTTVSLHGLDKYKGKPTLAIIFATWCASCNDATPYLEQLYATYHPQGLEVMAVAYDLSDDVKTNLSQLESFRTKFKIPWELLQVPCTTETWAKAMPPELEGWDGLPILLLVRPDGTVQTVFGGWFGPATGADGEKLRKWFEESTKTLVAAAKH